MFCLAVIAGLSASIAAPGGRGVPQQAPAKGVAHSEDPLATAPGLDTGRIIEQVRHNVAAVAAGHLRAEDRAYRADFTAAGFSLSLKNAAGTVTGGAALTVKTATVDTGAGPRAAVATPWQGSLNAAERLVAPGMLERVTARDGEIEWDFVMDAPPSGDVRIVAAVPGPAGVARGASLRFGRGTRTVRMAEMIVKDRTGKEIYRALPESVPGSVTLTVPQARLKGAAYPITIDPTVSPEYGVSDSAIGSSNTGAPAVAAGGSTWLVVWDDAKAESQSDIFATRVDSGGQVLDPLGIVVAHGPSNQVDPDVSWNGTHFVVVWQDVVDADTSAIMLARIATNGTVAFPASTVLDAGTSGAKPKVASVGSTSMVVWQGFGSFLSGRMVPGSGVPGNFASLPSGAVSPYSLTASSTQFLVTWSSTSPLGVFASRHATDGSMLGSQITVHTAGARPLAGWNGSVFAVTFHLSGDLVGKRVSSTGSVLDGSPVEIATEVNEGFKSVFEYPHAISAVSGGVFYLLFERVVTDFLFDSSTLRGTRLSGSSLLPLDPVGGTLLAQSEGGDVAWNGTHFLAVTVTLTQDGTRITSGGTIVDTFALGRGANDQQGIVASYDGTNFLLAWIEVKGFFAQTDEAKAARVSPTGTLLDPAGIAITPSGEFAVSVAATWDGTNHIVSWRNSAGAVRLVRVSPGGVTAAPLTVGTAESGGGSPALVGAGATTLIGYTDGSVLKVRRFAGTSFIDAAPVDSLVFPDGAFNVSLAYNGSTYLVVAASGSTVRAARLGASGVSIDGNGFIVASGTGMTSEDVASNGTDYLVTWQEAISGAHRVRTRRVSAQGAPEGSASTMNSGVVQRTPKVAWTGETYLVTWTDYRASTTDVYGARLTAAGSNIDGTGIPIAATDSYEWANGLVRGVRGRIAVTYQRYAVELRRAKQSFMRTFDDAVNDAFSAARTLTGQAASTDGINVGATEEAGEPNAGTLLGGKSVWFAWTAPAGGTLTADTFGSSFDTVLAVYTGTSVGSLTPVASNDDSGGLQSEVVFPVVAGRTYRISVDGFNASTTPANAAEGEYDLTLFLAVDSTPPQTTITGGPSGTVSDTHAVFTFTSSDAGSTFECSLDGAAFAACTSPATYTGLVPGSHTFSVRATDPAGNTDPSPATRTWTIDDSPPETTILTGPSGTVGSGDATFTFTSDDATATFECQIDGAGYAACVSPKSYTGLTTGEHTFHVRARDAAGNVDASPAARTWTVDVTAPDTTITGGPSAATSSTSASLTFTATEAGATFECSLDAAPFTSCTSPASYAGLTEAAHTFQVRATDAAGNTDATPASRSWTVDTTPPDTMITAGPSGPTASASASLSFTSPDAGATFACSLDAAPFTACTSPVAYNGLADGSHTFAVRASDAAGNADPTPASRSWTVDTASPVTTIDSAPSGSVASTSASISFHSSEPGSTHCSLDGAAFTSCTSPVAYTGLSQGAHTVRVRSTDPAGNVEPAPPSRTWTVDTVAPDTTISVAPPSLTSSRSASITFSSSETGSTFACSLDGAPFATCASPASYADLADGPHTVAVRATDAAGNTDSTPATASWTVDGTAPDTTITGGPSGAGSSREATFTFASTEAGSTFACSLDGAPFASCASPFTRTDLADGPHAFAVRAADAAGNTDPTPATASWSIDATAPDTTITDGPPGTVGASEVTFAFTATEAGSTFACRVDAAAFTTCSSPASFTVADGSHTFAVRATDAAGNTDATPATRAFAVDTTAPDTTIQSGPSGVVASTGATLSFAANEASTFACSIDGGVAQACTSPVSYSSLAEGEHTFAVRATDAAGNADATPATRSWTVDTTAPETTIVVGPAAATNSTSATFTFTSNDAEATYRCRLDAAAFTACSSPHTLSSLTEGSHTFEVIATDAVGNADATPAQRTWTVDTVAPNTSITSGPTGTTAATSASFTFTATETGATFQCRLDGGAFNACTPPFTADGMLDGSHTFEVRASDAAGNTDASPATRTWTVDTRAPETTITSGPSGPISATSATFTFVADETGSSFRCSLDGAAFTLCGSPTSYASLAQGSHTFRVKAVDTAGNEDATPASATFAVDTAAPAVALTRPTGGLWLNDQRLVSGDQVMVVGAITVQATATDASGIASFVFEVDGAPVAAAQVAFDPDTATYTFTYRPTTGMHTIVARATDATGLSRTASVSLVAVSV
ncbi:MAG TPA: Ig-like domain-containing protein [Actinomycetota bacterium]